MSVTVCDDIGSGDLWIQSVSFTLVTKGPGDLDERARRLWIGVHRAHLQDVPVQRRDHHDEKDHRDERDGVLDAAPVTVTVH